ncbi:uncharacterized protein EDB93DRAFT_1101288 [Suillus bovinus]|uniref:uncharacterized protein n=1 Tax=Suillus bovinus TaxID=48563 RepID=UPI001B874470|nr:uncharacterized protein EDB93DRAFT_1101288 [Suillus bovinus]KAG2156872.1 hypothetical protein EDB93DRAFT_1101288 [Suillus bovinus]
MSVSGGSPPKSPPKMFCIVPGELCGVDQKYPNEDLDCCGPAGPKDINCKLDMCKADKLSAFVTHSKSTSPLRIATLLLQHVLLFQRSFMVLRVVTPYTASLSPERDSRVFVGSYLVFREQGAIIEETNDEEDRDGVPESFDEKDGLAEKIALYLQDQQNFDQGSG